MSEEVIWFTVEGADAKEMRDVRKVVENTSLSDEYDIMVSSDKLTTIRKDELEDIVEQWPEEDNDSLFLKND